jgi:sec-independent protein translocase protein TatC
MANTLLRPVGHEDKLSLVEHLDELRTRLIVSLGVFLACFAVCFWQNDILLDIVNRPVEQTAFQKDDPQDPLEQAAIFQQRTRDYLVASAEFFRAQAADTDLSASQRETARELAERADAAVRSAPENVVRRPVTLGVGEPFFATFRVAAWAALLLSLPLILWQAYAFVLPAFSPRERQVALPLMAIVPFLFAGGVLFAYYVVVPQAIDFLQNYNDENFDILIQARDLYKFTILVCMAMGLLFQIPIGVLLLTRMEIVTVAQLRKHRRYAILVIAVMAMLLPGQDPVTMLLAMIPLVVLYEGSILLAALLQRRTARASELESADFDD